MMGIWSTFNIFIILSVLFVKSVPRCMNSYTANLWLQIKKPEPVLKSTSQSENINNDFSALHHFLVLDLSIVQYIPVLCTGMYGRHRDTQYQHVVTLYGVSCHNKQPFIEKSIVKQFMTSKNVKGNTQPCEKEVCLIVLNVHL